MNPADERPHSPGAHPFWAESWYVDIAATAGTGGFVQLTLYPNLGTSWWWGYFLTPGGLVAVRDHEVPLPRAGLEVRADGLWGEMVCETPLEHWSYGMEAFGLRFEDPLDAWGDELGERIPVGLDLEWEAAEAPGDVPAPGPPAGADGRAVQRGRVAGEILVGNGRIPVDAPGWRARRWGVCDWWTGIPYRWTAVPGRQDVVGLAPVRVTGPERRVARLARALVSVEETSGVSWAWAEWIDG